MKTVNRICDNHNGARASTDLFILHTAAAGWTGAQARDFFARDGNPSCNYYVDWNGEISEITPHNCEAFASCAANSYSVSVETAGDAGDAWTPAQIQALAELAAFLHKTYSIPLELVPDSRRGRRGIAYHRQGVPANAWQKFRGISMTGGDLWSKSPGKVCPGFTRISQIPQIIEKAKQITDIDQASKKGIKMFIIQSNAGHCYLVQDGGAPVHIPTPADVQALQSIGVPFTAKNVAHAQVESAFALIRKGLAK